MKKAILSSVILLLTLTSSVFCADKQLYQHLQDVSVTVNLDLEKDLEFLLPEMC